MSEFKSHRIVDRNGKELGSIEGLTECQRLQIAAGIEKMNEQFRQKLLATTRPPSGDTRFVLAPSYDHFRQACGVCGRSHRPTTPAWIFSKSGSLCHLCATRLAPTACRIAEDLELLHWTPISLGIGSENDDFWFEWCKHNLCALEVTDLDNALDAWGIQAALYNSSTLARIAELRELEREAEKRASEKDDDCPF